MGLSVRMVTGDHEAIAREIARQLHLGDRIVPAEEVFDDDAHVKFSEAVESADGFAQVFPEHKFEIVRALQAAGHVVGIRATE